MDLDFLGWSGAPVITGLGLKNSGAPPGCSHRRGIRASEFELPRFGESDQVRGEAVPANHPNSIGPNCRLVIRGRRLTLALIAPLRLSCIAVG
jgi:hypothetical protein